MVSVTTYAETTDRGICEILKRVNRAPEYDNGAIFRRASNAQSVECASFLMGLWLFDVKDYAIEAMRVLKAVLADSGSSVWIEPAIHSAMNEQNGWVVIYHLDLTKKNTTEHAKEIMAETPN